MNYEGQIFGTRKVISNRCKDSDWTSLGISVPSRKDKYVLTECLNCGAIIPSLIRNIKL